MNNTITCATNDFFLSQTVDMPTRNNNILDLFFTTNPTLVNKTITAPPLSEDADHNIVLVDLDTRPAVPKLNKQPRFIYSKANWEGLRKELENYILPDGSVQQRWDHLENAIITAMTKYIPYKPRKTNNQKPWVTRELITLFRKRDRLHKRWKQRQTLSAQQNFKAARANCQRLLRKSHDEYMETIFSADASSNKLWSFVKHKRKDACTVSPLRENGVLISDAVGKANILNRQYCSVFNNDNRGNEPSKGESTTPDMPPLIITSEGVNKMLKSLNPNKAAGPDQISPAVLRNLSDILSGPLANLFQASVDSGEVPIQWKRATVTPIFK